MNKVSSRILTAEGAQFHIRDDFRYRCKSLPGKVIILPFRYIYSLVYIGKRIAISGAGVGGTAFVLALEQACKSRGISPMPIIKLFERDNSPFARENLGYSFSIREGLPVRITCCIDEILSHC